MTTKMVGYIPQGHYVQPVRTNNSLMSTIKTLNITVHGTFSNYFSFDTPAYKSCEVAYYEFSTPVDDCKGFICLWKNVHII